MRRFILNKLVRDGIPDDMVKTGQNPKVRTLSHNEYIDALHNKFYEELGEVNTETPNAITELADLLEVLEAYASALGTDFITLRALQKQQREKRGGFGKRQYVESVSLADDNPWVRYYASQPERFEEVK